MDKEEQRKKWNKEEEIVKYIRSLTHDAKIEEKVPEELAEVEGLEAISEDIRNLRIALRDIGNGHLSNKIHGRGYSFGVIKELQATLKSLVWHTKVISSGDFSQKVDFLGEFSEAFNNMAESLETVMREKQEREEEIKRISETDPLTQLSNRLKLDHTLKKEMDRLSRSKSSCAIILLDIDHFKKVNDTFGHPIGDEVLKEIAKIISSNIRGTDIAGRWGGEEFMIIMPYSDNLAAEALAEKLRRKLVEHVFPTVGCVTASFGVAHANSGQASVENLISEADVALYRAKNMGRNQVCFYNSNEIPTGIESL